MQCPLFEMVTLEALSQACHEGNMQMKTNPIVSLKDTNNHEEKDNVTIITSFRCYHDTDVGNVTRQKEKEK